MKEKINTEEDNPNEAPGPVCRVLLMVCHLLYLHLICDVGVLGVAGVTTTEYGGGGFRRGKSEVTLLSFVVFSPDLSSIKLLNVVSFITFNPCCCFLQ